MAKILVVDDDESMTDLLRMHLRRDGLEIEIAADAAIALRCILAQAPDLIILDIDMPYMGGLEVLKALKSDPASSRKPVIMLTSHTDDETFSEAKKLGADAFLNVFGEKPRRAALRLAPHGAFSLYSLFRRRFRLGRRFHIGRWLRGAHDKLQYRAPGPGCAVGAIAGQAPVITPRLGVWERKTKRDGALCTLQYAREILFIVHLKAVARRQFLGRPGNNQGASTWHGVVMLGQQSFGRRRRACFYTEGKLALHTFHAIASDTTNPQIIVSVRQY